MENPNSSFSPTHQEIENFFSVSQDLQCIVRSDGVLEKLSYGWEKALGYLKEELTNTLLFDLVHPDDKERTIERIRRLASGEEVPDGFINRYRTKNGNYCTLEWNSKSFEGRIYSSARDISERIQFQKQLEFQHEWFSKALEASNAGVWDIDLLGKTIGVSGKWWKILGEKAPFPLSIPIQVFHNRIHPEDLPRMLEISQSFLSTGPSKFEMEFRMRHAEGGFVWVASKGTVLVNEMGIPYRVIGTNTDVTDKKKWEEALRAKTELLEIAGKIARLGYYEADMVHDTLYWSSVTCEIHETGPEYKPSMANMYSFFKEGTNRIRAIAMGKELLEHGIPFDGEFQIVTAKGREVWVRITAQADFELGVMKRVFGTIQDIDLQKKKALEELEKERLIQMLSGRKAGGWQWTVKEGKAYVLGSWCDILGYSLEEMNPMSLDKWMEMIHPEDVPGLMENWEQVLKGKDLFQTECRVRNKSGEWVWIQDNGKVFYNEQSGEPEMVYGAIVDISERKNAELQLRLFQNLIDQSSDGIQISHVNGQMVYINKTSALRLGIDQARVRDYNVRNFEHIFSSEEDWNEHVKELKEKGSAIIIGQNRNLQSKDMIPVEVHVKYLDVGHEAYLVAASRDISERIATQAKIESELSFQKVLLDIASTYLSIETHQFDSALASSMENIGRFLGADTAFVFDYDFQKGVATITHEWSQMGSSRDLDQKLEVPLHLITPVLEAHKQGKYIEITFEDQLEGHEGEYILFMMKQRQIKSLIVLPLKDGEDLLGFIGFDYTTRIGRFSEKDKSLLLFFNQMLVNVKNRQIREKRLVSLEEKYRNILNNANMGLLDVNSEGFIQFSNQGISVISGIPCEELNGKHVGDLFFGEEGRAEFKKHMERRLKGETESYETTFTRSDGSFRHWWVNAAPNFNDKGVCIGSVKIFLDITEKKKLEEEQWVLAELTQNQNKRLRNFAHIVSHNLRSHASNILSLVDLQVESEGSYDTETLLILQNASKNLMETIEHLSEVAQLTTFDQKGMEFLILADFLDRAISHVSGLALRNGVEIRNEVTEFEVILGVPAYVESVLLNLLTNAIKYRNPERRDCYVAIRSRKNGSNVIVEMEDNGLGINLQRHRSKIFGMYKTFHRLPDSKGLGLFITRNQVEAMGGTIEVESIEGKGSTFYVTLQRGKK